MAKIEAHGWLAVVGLLVLALALPRVIVELLGSATPKAAWLGMTRGQIAFVAELVVLLLAFAVIGIGINRRFTGVLIDSRNRYSVVQLTFYAWTVIVVAGLAAAGLVNVALGVKDPLGVKVPAELFAAMGLSATTLVGTPIIRSVKRGATPPPGRVAPAEMVGAALVGRVVEFGGAASARWQDLFQGEEDGNADKADLSRIQLFYLTSLAVAVYGAAMFASFAATGRLEFPALDQSLVGLLLLGNGAALAYQAAPHG